jgi:hypothetical protein
MHNKDKQFQYFVLDFEGENSATHGSHMLFQAGFMNEALRVIMSMYNQSLQESHSVEGDVEFQFIGRH